MRTLHSAAVLASLLVSGCAVYRAPLPNPSGLTAEAMTLEYMLDRGCLPYVLGEKTEDKAMRDLRLYRLDPLILPFDPDPPAGPVWKGLYPGLGAIGVGGTSCTVTMQGGRLDDYRTATRAALDHRLGPAIEPDFADFAPLPERLTGCRQDVHYAYYEERRLFATTFHVELNRTGCSRFRAVRSPSP